MYISSTGFGFPSCYFLFVVKSYSFFWPQLSACLDYFVLFGVIKYYFVLFRVILCYFVLFCVIFAFFAGVRQEQDLFVRLIDSVTKQVPIHQPCIFNYLIIDCILS